MIMFSGIGRSFRGATYSQHWNRRILSSTLKPWKNDELVQFRKVQWVRFTDIGKPDLPALERRWRPIFAGLKGLSQRVKLCILVFYFPCLS